MSENGYAQYGCAPEMSTSDSVAIRTWPIAWLPTKRSSRYSRPPLGVAEVLDDLQRMADREHLRAAERPRRGRRALEVAVVAEVTPRTRTRCVLDAATVAPSRDEPPLDLRPVAAQPVLELEVARRVRVGELHAHRPSRRDGGPYSA